MQGFNLGTGHCTGPLKKWYTFFFWTSTMVFLVFK